jgi:hypothetical protein
MKRPQFCLRTLFVAVTILAIPLGWLAWQAETGHHRELMLATIKANGGNFYIGIDLDRIRFERSPQVVIVRPVDNSAGISKIRELLGDGHIDLIGFNRQLTAVDRAAIEAFPEAKVMAIP